MYLVREVDFVGKAVPECPETVGHQGVQLTVGELVQILLQVGTGRLGTGKVRSLIQILFSLGFKKCVFCKCTVQVCVSCF